ncbi:MAG TPA: SDR family oxidoreductase [Pyrinomonadaceae bacterium]
MQKVLVLGGTGMLGHKLVQVFNGTFDTYCTIRDGKAAFELLGIVPRDRVIDGVSAEDFQTVERAIRIIEPDVVVNAIGIIKQLPSSKDVVQTLTVNSILPHQVASLAGLLGFRFITLSTDCVFSGGNGNYSESDRPDSVDVYGLSKFLGEVHSPNSLTIRTSIIGRELGTAHGLIEWFLSQEGRVNGYSKAIFSGFPTIVLAELLAAIIRDFPRLEGLYHVSSDAISKFELLNLVRERLKRDVLIDKDEEFVIDRSLDSTRFREATGFSPLPWKEMVDRMFSDPTRYDEWNK